MDSVLLDALTILLAQALPVLRSAGGKAAEKVVEEAGKQAGLWAKLRGKVEAKPAAAEAAEDVALEPDDEGARASLRHQLGKILAADPDLAAEIAQLVAAARPSFQVTFESGARVGTVVINANAGPADSKALWQSLGTAHPSADLTRATAVYLQNLVQRYQYLDFKGLG
jgi:hypothetical protein